MLAILQKESAQAVQPAVPFGGFCFGGMMGGGSGTPSATRLGGFCFGGMMGGGSGTPSATRLGGFCFGGMMGGGSGTPSATRLGGFCFGGMMGGGSGTPSATRFGGFCFGGMMGGGSGTPSATSLGGCFWRIMGGGAGTPSARTVPLFQVGNMREWLTGIIMASRIRLTEIATESVSSTFFKGTLLRRKSASSQSRSLSAREKVPLAEHCSKLECLDARSTSNSSPDSL